MWTGCVFNCLKPSSNGMYHLCGNIHNCVPCETENYFYTWFRWMSLFQGSSAPGLGHTQWCSTGAIKIIHSECWMYCREYTWYYSDILGIFPLTSVIHLHKLKLHTVLQDCNKHVNADMTVNLTPSMKLMKPNCSF